MNHQEQLFSKEHNMPKLKIIGVGEFEVPAGTRLVNALEDHITP